MDHFQGALGNLRGTQRVQREHACPTNGSPFFYRNARVDQSALESSALGPLFRFNVSLGSYIRA